MPGLILFSFPYLNSAKARFPLGMAESLKLFEEVKLNNNDAVCRTAPSKKGLLTSPDEKTTIFEDLERIMLH